MTEDSSVRARAEQLLQGRLQAITGLETALAELTEAQAHVERAQQKVDDEVRTATDAGWTEVELKQLGITVPPSRRKRGGGPKRPRSAGGGTAGTPDRDPATSV